MPDRRPHVLVVDDNLEMARTLAYGLADGGYDATALASGRDAIDRLGTERFDAVVTDLRMPRVDGLELLAASRRLDPDRPVIVMTAYSAIDSAVESIRQGAYHYLTKPFKVDELALFLDRALEDTRLRREAIALKRTLRERFGLANVVGEIQPQGCIMAGEAPEPPWARARREKRAAHKSNRRDGATEIHEG